ncbi:MAG: hypothetical protein ACLUSP_11395 [Christensenellales bacterium]
MENDNFTSLPATRLAPPAKTVRESVKVKDVVSYVIIYLFLILVCFTCVFPFFWMITSSLQIRARSQLVHVRFSQSPQGAITPVFGKATISSAAFSTPIVESRRFLVCVYFGNVGVRVLENGA